MSNTGRIQNKLFHVLGQPSIPAVVTPDLPAYKHFGCGCDFTLKALADNSGEDIKNDRAGFLWWFADDVTDAELTLQKWVNGAWTDLATLSNNTYGTNYEWQFFTNNAGENFIGYQIEWANVLSTHGEGSYRVTCSTTDYLANENTLYSYEYCLKTYTAERANGTIRVEYFLNGTLGRNDDDKMVKDLGSLNWYNALRLNGWFGYPKSKYEETRYKYDTGQSVFVSDEQEPEYELQVKMAPFFVHEIFRTDIMQADTVLISDYNNSNVTNYYQKAVRKNSSYEPGYHVGINKLSSCTTKWLQEYNNHKKLLY